MSYFKDGEIQGVIIKKLESYLDSRGWLIELFRKDDAELVGATHSEDSLRVSGFEPAMSYISVTYPGAIRGPHEHREQTDYFCFLGKFSIYLWDNRKNSPTYKNKKVIENADRLIVIIPPGVAHAYKNIGNKDGMVINFPDRLYAGWGKKEEVDEIRYENDTESPFRVE